MTSKINIDPRELESKIYELKELHDLNYKKGLYTRTYDKFVEALFKPMRTSEDMVHHACTGISGEAGELLDASKKTWAYGKPYDLENIIEELGDIRFFYQALLNMIGVEDALIVHHNMGKLSKRFPDLVYKDSDAITRGDKNEK